MGKKENSNYLPWLPCSLLLNIIFIFCNLYYMGGEWTLGWTQKAAEEAEAAAAISCSGHGRAYLDGLVLEDGKPPPCECNYCYRGHDCSEFIHGCAADANSGDPLFLEPFWLENAASGVVVVAGWHRMSYEFGAETTVSAELERQIRQLHEMVGNAVTKGRYVVFGAGSTQLLNAAVHALSPENSSSPAKVVARVPYYSLYEQQTNFFESEHFSYYGDAALWSNDTNVDTNLIEFVTSPNNPDGKMNKAVLHGKNVKRIYDHAYYWPHFTAISAPADEDLMIFTLSKLTGHAGSRFGWAVVKDEAVYQRMMSYVNINILGVSRDSQLRAFKLLKVVLEEEGRKIFEFGYETMKNRWKRLSNILSTSKRFSLEETPPQFCTYFKKFRQASPAYAWLKCEREEDVNCYEVLKSANIIGRPGRVFGSEDRFVRLSLVKREDDMDILLHHLSILVSEEDGAKTL